MVTVTAAVSRGAESPFSFETLELRDPGPDEILVRITSCGLCHTDLAVIDLLEPQGPAVLGHEGVGVVEQVGADVAEFRPGDRVALSFAWCGHCKNCLSGRPGYCEKMLELNFGSVREGGSADFLGREGTTVRGGFFGQSSFATHALVAARGAVRIPDGIDLDLVGPLGCGLQTGAGAIINTLAVPAGSSVMISGVGAVGLAAVMAAKAVGATTIIAVDVLASRLDVAVKMGATHVVDGKDEDVIQRAREITGGRGVEYAFDTTGIAPVILNDLGSLQIGGELGLVASGPEGSSLPLAAFIGKTVHHLVQGDAVPRDFIPELLALHAAGRFPFDELIAKYPFEKIAQAVEDTRTGASVKAVLVMVGDDH
jgi:aryl-alcohol dehydrogenase